jgi:hypothetical protein
MGKRLGAAEEAKGGVLNATPFTLASTPLLTSAFAEPLFNTKGFFIILDLVKELLMEAILISSEGIALIREYSIKLILIKTET